MKSYDTTVARIAGNILSGVLTRDKLSALSGGLPPNTFDHDVVLGAVAIARAIVAEVKKDQETGDRS